MLASALRTMLGSAPTVQQLVQGSFNSDHTYIPHRLSEQLSRVQLIYCQQLVRGSPVLELSSVGGVVALALLSLLFMCPT